MRKHQYLLILVALVFFLLPCGATTTLARNPNVIVVLTDDQGWGDLSLSGNTNLATPHIDSLARDGVSFDRFFVCPVCSPTRAEFLTGRYHPRSGVYSTSAGGERMDADEQTIGDIFKQAGYATAAFGKWHNGMQYPYHPNARGFDEYYGFCSGHWGNYFSPMLERNGKITQGDGFIIDDLTNQAIRFIEKNREQPFFVYLPYNTPHSPMQVPDPYWERFKDKELTMRHRDRKETMPHARCALAMCENIDWNVGRILKKLAELKLDEETIVVFFHDNGPNGSRWNGDMKGRKGSTDEGGVRSPLLVRYPAKLNKGQQIKEIAGAIDLLPTLRDLAGITAAPKKRLDGVSLVPLLAPALAPTKLDAVAKFAAAAKSPSWPERFIFNHWRGKVSVRSQRFRLDHRGNLFDMVADPGQRMPIKNANVSNQMSKAAKAWRDELLPELESDNRPFVLGDPNAKYTQLPARDAKTTGNLKRSNRFPNCSFFSNWTSTDDRITWDVEVPADGKFQVDAFYTCPASDVGSTIQLSFNEAKVEARIAASHNPPLIGADQDRHTRAESYVKDFKPLSLGVIHLKKGSGQLALRATEIPGDQVMDFRLLMFTRVE